MSVPATHRRTETETRVPDVLGEIMTAQQVAELLQMQRSTVEDYGRRGVIPSIKLGRHRRYIRSDVVALIEQLR